MKNKILFLFVVGMACAMLTVQLRGDEIVIDNPFNTIGAELQPFGALIGPQVVNIGGENAGVFWITADGFQQGISLNIPAVVGNWNVGVDWLASNPNYYSPNTLLFTATFQSGEEAGWAFQNQGDGNFGLYRLSPGGSVDPVLDQTDFPQGSAWRRLGMSQTGEEISFSFGGVERGTFRYSNLSDPLTKVTISGYRPSGDSIPVFLDNLHVQAQVAPVPEPSTILLFGIGLAFLLRKMRC